MKVAHSPIRCFFAFESARPTTSHLLASSRAALETTYSFLYFAVDFKKFFQNLRADAVICLCSLSLFNSQLEVLLDSVH